MKCQLLKRLKCLKIQLWKKLNISIYLISDSDDLEESFEANMLETVLPILNPFLDNGGGIQFIVVN